MRLAFFHEHAAVPLHALPLLSRHVSSRLFNSVGWFIPSSASLETESRFISRFRVEFREFPRFDFVRRAVRQLAVVSAWMRISKTQENCGSREWVVDGSLSDRASPQAFLLASRSGYSSDMQTTRVELGVHAALGRELQSVRRVA